MSTYSCVLWLSIHVYDYYDLFDAFSNACYSNLVEKRITAIKAVHVMKSFYITLMHFCVLPLRVLLQTITGRHIAPIHWVSSSFRLLDTAFRFVQIVSRDCFVLSVKQRMFIIKLCTSYVPTHN